MKESGLDIELLSSWLPKAGSPAVVAGPCSAETEKQVLEVAEKLASTGRVSLFRAGIWKPRTRPNSFEGIGDIGLQWLIKAAREFGIQPVIEVANEEHVKKALDAGIRHLWIGARTTVNPFSVQEIADALEGVDVPVMVKNPLNPDLQLWIGALERLNKAGINKLVAVHRGFNTYQDHIFRNSPNWEIPIELKTRFPQLPLLVDPSHISGKRSLLHEVSQKALDLGFDGLMVETHPNPDEAWSDPKQQIFLDQFEGFLNKLEARDQHFKDSIAINRLEQLRQLIDQIDHNLLENLRHRLEIVEQIGHYKAEHNVTVFQLDRWRQILSDRLEHGEAQGLKSELVKAIWGDLHKASIQLQTEITQRHLRENA